MSQRSEQEIIRINKLKELREQGFEFPNDVRPTLCATDLEDVSPADPIEEGERYTVAGRIVQLRLMGKAAFVHILDRSGKMQLYVRRDDVGTESYSLFKRFDIGDIIEASGYIFVTRTGEKTLHAESVRLLTKSLIPLPEKWHGLTDVEARYRHRYVDLIANPDVRGQFHKRARIIKEVRSFLDQRDFIEVETPVLAYEAGGATAKPFQTHYNALHCDMFLRIALELPLKKLLVGGLERVYELGRNFRNEGLSKKHNPEFTMLEFYQCYATFEDLMDLTEELLATVVRNVHGETSLTYGEHTIDFGSSFARYTMVDSVYEVGGVSKDIDLHTVAGVKQAADTHDIHLEEADDWGRSLDVLWESLVEPKLIQPTFITHHPFSISPLARKNKENPQVTDRFELIIAGMEVANAFSELNDAEDQLARFEAQAARKAAGDEEAPEIAHDFVRALEYGMPPAAGEGIGIDRLVMLLTNASSIRDVLLFPQLKPLDEQAAVDEEE